MTLEEKVAQTYHFAAPEPPSHGFKNFTETSFGAVSMNGDPEDTSPSAHVQKRNELQATFMKSSRLGIPIMFSDEGLHGGGKGATVFPELVTVGSTWNTTLAHDIGEIVARAGRSTGADLLFAPVINLFTDPRYGRLQEAFSENPTITAHLGAAYVGGLQGDLGAGPGTYLDKYHVAALGKHYAGYGGALGGLNAAPLDVTNRTLQDVYLKPWRAFGAAGGRGVMPSHNTVNGIPAHANEALLNGQLRKGFGFGLGLSVSDCNDIGVLEDFRFAANATDRAAIAVRAGVDMDLMCGDPDDWSYTHLQAAVEAGQASEADLDAAVTHVLTHKFAAGLFDSPLTPANATENLNLPSHRKLGREAAAQGSVLLKNEGGVLPLKGAGSPRDAAPRVLVVGENGGCGSGARPGPPTDGCTARINIMGSYTQVSEYINVSTVHEALGSSAWAAASGASVAFSQGATIDKDDESLIPAAVAAAQGVDVVVAVLGDSLRTCGEWVDRDSLDLPGSQLALLAALQANTTAKIVVVLVNGRPATFGPGNALLDGVDALVASFRPGQMGAEGIADILTGAANPSGRLALNWPRSVGDVHSGASPWLQERVGKWISNTRGSVVDPDGRRYDPYEDGPLTGSPLFRLGDGLSYTTFEISDLKAEVNATVATLAKASSEGAVGRSALVRASVTVSNTGARDADCVVQLYGVDPVGVGVVRPWKRIFGFARVPVPAGGSMQAEVSVIVDDVAFHDADMQYRVAPGTYTLRAGLSSGTDTLTMPLDI